MERLSHYEIQGELGRGGMGVVYRAVDSRLGRAVAIKVLPPEATSDPDRRRRFIQEARAASALNHPNIVTIHEVDEHDGITFIVMELVEGTPLDRLLASTSLSIERALGLATQIAAALEAAHGAGIVHRDIKPANIVVGADDRARVLDFGLAKLIERSSSDATISVLGTSPGTIIGTAAYMSPEQAQGETVDARSDVFSFGAVVYEMLSGRRPFTGSSDIGLLTAILRDAPAPLRSVRSEIPADVEAIVNRALAKAATSRYATVGEMRAALADAHARITRPADALWRRPALLVPAALLLVALAGLAVWQTVQARRVRWAQLDAIPQIERLFLSGRSMQAVRLARDAERYAPEEIAQLRAGWLPFNVVTEPEGAHIVVRNYNDMQGEWEPLGESPIRGVRLPFGYYRAKITKPGYKTLEVSVGLGRSPVKLTPEAETAPGMVFVPGGDYATGVARPVKLPDYWIGQLEVTNREYKQFVDAGGYRDRKFWKHEFRDGATVLTFDDAMLRFRDATAQPGPSTWELGSYPEGQDDYPVGGISWFEAAAYAEFAGKSLPSIYHWFRAAGTDEVHSDILQQSNFESKGPTRAGERQGVGPWGTLDMAGNIKEWCANEVQGSGRRYILGGGWNEPSYRFAEQDAQDPWIRRSTYGMRVVKNLGPADAALAPVPRVTPDPSTIVPVSDELFALHRRVYNYDRLPLDARVESVDDRSPHWRKETISFAAAYGNDRVPAFLFLPKNASPPYQTVVFFPTAYAINVPSSTNLDLGTFEFLVRSGRAVIYPVYQGTFERRKNVQPGPTGRREWNIQAAKDVFRAVDYLESRPDIDRNKLAYYSLSMGAFFGPIPVALEPRLKLAVFAAGGLRYFREPEEQPANFAPRVKVPVLIVHGKDDFGVPSADQKRFVEILGTPAEHKKHIVLEGGHVPQDIRGLFREVLAFLDHYFGPVK